jgi:hypothetical protein
VGDVPAPGRSCGIERDPGPVPWLDKTLAVIREFGAASAELIAWELFLDSEEVGPAVGQALADGLIEDAGLDIQTGEQLYRLVDDRADGSAPRRRRA